MAQPAAKKGDQIVSDGTSKVWVQPPGGPPPPPVTVPFAYGGSIDAVLSGDVFVNGMPVAVAGSSSQTAVPPASQPNVISAGTPLSAVDNTATVTGGSQTVFVNGKTAARNADKATT
jgi:uncharacterized Zn-binding protein involved in type VI secretion